MCIKRKNLKYLENIKKQILNKIEVIKILKKLKSFEIDNQEKKIIYKQKPLIMVMRKKKS